MTPSARPVSGASTHPNGQITRGDIEAKLRSLRGEVGDAAQAAKGVGLAVGAVAVIAVVGISFWLGRRRGRKETTVVEIRRV